MMLLLSIISLLDGLQQFLSTPGETEYKFVAVDSTFLITFHKFKNARINVFASDCLIHTATAAQLRRDVENSITEFVHKNDLDQRMNAAEAGDLHDALEGFRASVA